MTKFDLFAGDLHHLRDPLVLAEFLHHTGFERTVVIPHADIHRIALVDLGKGRSAHGGNGHLERDHESHRKHQCHRRGRGATGVPDGVAGGQLDRGPHESQEPPEQAQQHRHVEWRRQQDRQGEEAAAADGPEQSPGWIPEGLEDHTSSQEQEETTEHPAGDTQPFDAGGARHHLQGFEGTDPGGRDRWAGHRQYGYQHADENGDPQFTEREHQPPIDGTRPYAHHRGHTCSDTHTEQ